jgi:hypothetical protein
MKAHLQDQSYNEKEFKAQIVAFLKTRPQGVTLSEVVLATGLATEWVDFTLRQLLNDFPAHLEINENKELIYQFDFTPKQTSITQTLTESLVKILDFVWLLFTFGFKVWIVAMLFTYMLFNTVVLLVAIIAITRSGELLEGAYKLFGDGIVEAFRMLFKKNQDKKQGLIQQVFSYVFGQSKANEDKLKWEKLILRHIEQNKGELLVSDIVQLTGWSVRESQEQAAKLLANYQGDAEVSNEGVIIYKFPDLITKTGTSKSEPPKIWQNLIPNVLMNDNEKKVNRSIITVNSFNIVMAFLSTFLIQGYIFEDEAMPNWIWIFSMYIPLIYSIIFFLIPLGRMPWVAWENTKIDKRNQHYKVLGEIFQKLPQSIDLEQDSKKIAEKIGQKNVSEIKKIVQTQSLALEAEPKTNEKGNVIYDFEQINIELNYGQKSLQNDSDE